MPLESPNWVASGNIPVSCFVTPDTTVQRGAKVATGNNVLLIGISQAGAREAPLPSSTGIMYAAKDGEPVKIYGEGAVCSDLMLGGTVSSGNLLTSDSNGNAVTAGGNGTYYGAIALGNGVAGSRIPAQVIIGVV